MSKDPSGTAAREWRLHWSKKAARQPWMSFDHDDDQEVGLWVGSRDPHKLKAFSAGQGWADDRRLEMSVSPPPDGSDRWRSVNCHVAQIAAWDPDVTELPEHVAGLEPKPTSMAGRLAMLRAMKAAVDKAVADEVLHPDDAAGLMLLARDAMERMKRSRAR